MDDPQEFSDMGQEGGKPGGKGLSQFIWLLQEKINNKEWLHKD